VGCFVYTIRRGAKNMRSLQEYENRIQSELSRSIAITFVAQTEVLVARSVGKLGWYSDLTKG